MKTLLLALALSLSVATSARLVAAEPAAADSTLHSYQQARTVLTRALELAGGEANIRRLRNVSIEAFRGKRVISDKSQTMVLYDIGPNAHSEELTIVHLPKQGIVWQADVYFSPMTGGGVNPAMPIGIDFAKKLKSLGITEFKSLIEAHHPRIVTMEEFRRALALSGYRDY